MANIGISAQFGGQDAADSVLKEFNRLKKAAKGIEAIEFPFEKLAFILRVNGVVNDHGTGGLGPIVKK